MRSSTCIPLRSCKSSDQLVDFTANYADATAGARKSITNTRHEFPKPGNDQALQSWFVNWRTSSDWLRPLHWMPADRAGEAELTTGQGRALSGHRTERSYGGYAKITMERALAATRKRHAHRLVNEKAHPFRMTGRMSFRMKLRPMTKLLPNALAHFN